MNNFTDGDRRTSGICRMILQAILYNVLSLCQAYRLEHILDTLDADFVLLTGTRQRAKQGFEYHVSYVGRYTVIHFGWSAGGLFSRAAGCAIAIHNRHSAARIAKINTCAVQGRGGSVRMKSWYMDVKLIVGYPPPNTTCPRK